MNPFSRNIWCVAGLPFDAVNMSVAIDCVKKAIVEQQPYFLSTPNLNFLMAAQTDQAFRHSVINSDLSVADGMPLIWMARMLNIPLPERVPGSGIMETLFAEQGGAPIRIYFFGGETGVGERACRTINHANSRLQAVGSYCPGFGSVEAMSSDTIIAEINRHQIDFLIVALGAKKGQDWIERNRHRLNAPVISHLGAVVNFFAGTIKRAPVWMQRFGFEWLWRIIQEPQLWKRYFSDGMQFSKLLMSQVIPYAFWIRMNQPLLNDARPLKVDVVEGEKIISLKLTGACTDKTIAVLRPVFREFALKGKNVRIDLQNAAVIDGAFLGLCLVLYKHLNQNGYWLNLVHAGAINKKIIHWNRGDFLLN
jgi:N-acetylglucosaminyldiphosphoundecaprenol N-acetyl-beta-D-mannosaminyltransferase